MATDNTMQDSAHDTDACQRATRIASMLSSDLPDEDLDFLAEHLEVCESCRRRAMHDSDRAEVEDDLKWVDRQVRARADMGIPIPLRRISELLPEYEIIREIARGGMGVVYEARQINLNRKVALKVLPALLGAARPDAATRFRREAEITARLKHNNIIAVHDFGEADGTFYYAMELIDGRSLRDILDEIEASKTIDVVLGIASGSSSTQAAKSGTTKPSRRTTLGSAARSDRQYFRQVATWIAEIAEAVHYAHSQGIIHRDIKPSNMILARDGRLMIADFGLARAADGQGITRTQAIVGTARYMSPEQADRRHGPTSQATDVYGLGATLYELLTLRPMFSGQDVDVVQAVLHKEPTPPRRLVRQVPRELETICLKAVEKIPAARFGSAQELADDLRRWLLGVPIEAKRQRWPARAIKFARRRKLAVSAVLAVIVLGTVSMVVARQASRWEADALAAQAKAEAREIDALCAAAQRQLDDGEFEGGLKRIDAALRQYPDAGKLRLMRASLLERLGRRKEAVDELESLLAVEPRNADAHLRISTSYYNLRNKEMGDRHATLYLTYGGSSISSQQRYKIQARIETDPVKQIELFTKVLALDPSDVGSVLVRSNLYGRVHRFDDMLADAERAVAMRPNWALSHGYLGSAYATNNDNKAAEQAFGRAIELDPNNPEWWTGRALARGNLGQYEGALLDATRAIEINTEFAGAYAARGAIKAALGDPRGGLLDCARAIELEPMNREHYHRRMYVYKLTGDWAKFGEDATRVIELKPNDLRGYAYRALSLMNRSYYAEAIEDYHHAIELDPTNVTNMHNRGLCFLRLGRLEEAVADFSECIRIDAEYIPAFEKRAVTLRRLEANLKAIADITRAIELGGENVERLRLRARLAIQIGSYDDAIQDCTRVLDQDPQDTVSWLFRGMANELMGAKDAALADYATVVSRGGDDAGYAWLWKHYLQPDGDGPSPTNFDKAVMAVADGLPKATWIQRLYKFANEELSSDELLAAATNDEERAEALYYSGRDALLNGNTASAKQALEDCVALHRYDLPETEFAQALLHKLTKVSSTEGVGSAPSPR